MINYQKLSDGPDKDGMADFIVNKSKNNYLNLRSANPEDTIKAVILFMQRYAIWNTADEIVPTKKPVNFVPSNIKFHDISFVLVFYDLACRSKETKEQSQVDVFDEPVDNKPVKSQKDELNDLLNRDDDEEVVQLLGKKGPKKKEHKETKSRKSAKVPSESSESEDLDESSVPGSGEESVESGVVEDIPSESSGSERESGELEDENESDSVEVQLVKSKKVPVSRKTSKSVSGNTTKPKKMTAHSKKAPAPRSKPPNRGRARKN